MPAGEGTRCFTRSTESANTCCMCCSAHWALVPRALQQHAFCRGGYFYSAPDTLALSEWVFCAHARQSSSHGRLSARCILSCMRHCAHGYWTQERNGSMLWKLEGEVQLPSPGAPITPAHQTEWVFCAHRQTASQATEIEQRCHDLACATMLVGTGPKSLVAACLLRGRLFIKRPGHPGAVRLGLLRPQTRAADSRRNAHETHLLVGPMPHPERNASGWMPLQPRYATYSGECRGAGSYRQQTVRKTRTDCVGCQWGRGAAEQEMHTRMHEAGGRQVRGGAGSFPYLSLT